MNSVPHVNDLTVEYVDETYPYIQVSKWADECRVYWGEISRLQPGKRRAPILFRSKDSWMIDPHGDPRIKNLLWRLVSKISTELVGIFD